MVVALAVSIIVPYTKAQSAQTDSSAAEKISHFKKTKNLAHYIVKTPARWKASYKNMKQKISDRANEKGTYYDADFDSERKSIQKTFRVLNLKFKPDQDSFYK